MDAERRHRPPERELTASEIAALTTRFRAVRDQMYASAVEATAALGAIVLEGQHGLPWGRFEAWVVGDLKMKVRTAYRMAAVAGLAESHPRFFDKLKKYGPTRVADVASLPGPAVARLVRGSASAVGAWGSVGLRRRVARYRPKRASVNARARATKAAAAATRAREAVESLEGHWDRVPDEALRELTAALASLCSLAAKKPWQD